MQSGVRAPSEPDGVVEGTLKGVFGTLGKIAVHMMHFCITALEATGESQF